MTTDQSKPIGYDETRTRLYVVLAAIFVTCLVLGDVVGGKAFRLTLWETEKLVDVGGATMQTLVPVTTGAISVGMILFPVTFLLTDVINDFYGRRGAQFITLVGAAMATLAYFALVLTTALPIDPESYFQQGEYAKIFGGSAKLFIASIIAYLVGQLLDIHVFQFWKRLTQSKHIWLRATGSTLVSQIVDTAIINTIFWGGVADKTPGWIAAKIGREYLIKVLVAILLTPLVYAIHAYLVRVLRLKPEPVATK
jgi:queuosine precursor transporter